MPSKLSEANRLPMAKWGAACAPCAAAKAKCIRSDSSSPGAKCDRCQRLLKDCTGQIHRPRKKRESKPSRTAQIQERLDGLVNLLQVTGELGSGRLSQKASESAPGSVPLTPAARPLPLSPTERLPASASSNSDPWIISDDYNAFAVPACICRPETGYAPPPLDSDNVLLDIYRTEMQPVYPFVIVPPSLTAADLQSTKPFLLSAIRMVASFRSLRSMRGQMCHLMRHISDYMLIRSERSLDLLQGIIVMLGWYQYHCIMHAQMNNLIALATSLIGDLGLNHAPSLPEQASLMVARPAQPAGRTNDERRALAAVWFLTSTSATIFGRSESLRFSPYLQDCIRHLEASEEYETDAILAFIVRMQHLTERIFDLNARDKTAEEVHLVPPAPTLAYVHAFQHELDRMRNSLPPSLRTDATMQVYLNTATLRLYEPPVADVTLIRQISQSLTMGMAGAGTALDQMYQTSSALRTWFGNWLSIPVSSYYRQPVAIASQLVYALTMLGRWAKLATPRTMYEGETPISGYAAQAVLNSDPQMAKANSDLEAAEPPAQFRYNGKTRWMDEAVPDLPAAVGALQSQLQMQPGLSVNIPEILSALCSRFEEVNSTFEDASADSGKTDNNIWSYSALKIRITRVKLERWAELVSAVAEASDRQPRPEGQTAGPWQGPDPRPMVEPGLPGPGPLPLGSLAQDQTQIQNYLGTTPWTNQVANGVDGNVWFDDYLDWGAVIMNSMGMAGQ